MHTVYFDLDGTLVEFDRPYARLYERALERLGVDAHEGDVYAERFFEVLGEAADPYATAIEATNVAVDPVAFSESIRTVEVEHTVAVPGAFAVLESLRGTRALGVLTNGLGDLQRAKLEAVDLVTLLDDIVVADEVGAWKPDPELYRVAEDRLPATTYTFVADDLERDVRPAIECGWRGIYVDPERTDHAVDERDRRANTYGDADEWNAGRGRVHWAASLADCLEYL